jgi:heme/copper-type cytochrome/quinol oxidase subunit 2
LQSEKEAVDMKKKKSREFIALVMFGILALPAVRADEPRTIEIVATGDDAFRIPGQASPVIHAKPGEPLILKVTAQKGSEWSKDGAVHSLVIRSLRAQGWDYRLHEGSQVLNAKAPDSPGEYAIECTVKCGRGHEDMKMKLIVEK